MNFVPDTPTQAKDVPFFEEARESDGWQGQTTGKSIQTLQSEIMAAISRLGGTTTGFQKGKFDQRDGFRVLYVVPGVDGRLLPGRIDVAALPVRARFNDRKREQSLRMALFMLRDALKGTWFLQQLSPGYAALMPWMLADEDRTISQLWSESPAMRQLMPPNSSDDFVEGAVEEE